jgi:uncharacterized damage-inducible protein DinB
MKPQLLSTLETSRQYTLDVADAMPAAGYDFKPVDGVWNFGELMHHIAYGIHWWEQNYILGKETEWAPPAPESDKAKLRAGLEKAYKALAKSIGDRATDAAAVSGFHNTLHHIAHHRGQAVTYLRCMNVAAPEYVY